MSFFKKIIYLIIILIYALFYPAFNSFAEDEGYKPSGPIPVTNQNPLYIFFLNPVPDTTSISKQGKLAIDLRYSMANVNVKQTSYPPAFDVDRVELDMEVHKFDLVFDYGLSERLSLSLDVPYLIFWQGFLDSAVEFFEDSLNVTSPSSRGDWGMNDYKYFLRYDNHTLIDRDEPENGPGDLTLSLKYKFLKEQEILPSLALRTSVKFPTGSDSKLLGSGEFDYSLGILGQKQIAKLFIYLNSDVILIKRPDVLSPMPLDEYMISGFLGFEYFLSKKFSLMLQAGVATSPYPDVDLVTSLEHVPVHIGLGLNYRFNKATDFKFAVIENGTSAWPDITLHTSLKLKF